MSGKVNLIEVELEGPCTHCGRKKLKQSEKFYKVFIGDKETGIVVCELCKGGFYTLIAEGSEKTHATHLTFYIKRTLLEFREKLPETIRADLDFLFFQIERLHLTIISLFTDTYPQEYWF